MRLSVKTHNNTYFEKYERSLASPGFNPPEKETVNIHRRGNHINLYPIDNYRQDERSKSWNSGQTSRYTMIQYYRLTSPDKTKEEKPEPMTTNQCWPLLTENSRIEPLTATTEPVKYYSEHYSSTGMRHWEPSSWVIYVDEKRTSGE